MAKLEEIIKTEMLRSDSLIQVNANNDGTDMSHKITASELLQMIEEQE